MYDERVFRKADHLTGNEQDRTIPNNTVFQEQLRAGTRAQSLHDEDTSHRPEALGNLGDIPGKGRLVSFVPQQEPTSA